MKECCLNCRYYWNKCCHNNDVFSNKKSILSGYQSLSEDGYISDMMNETNFGKLEDFELALENLNYPKER